MSFLTAPQDRKSTRLNSSHVEISYAVFCLQKKSDRSRSRVRPLPQDAFLLVLRSYDHPVDLHSFPTRRSSDLEQESSTFQEWLRDEVARRDICKPSDDWGESTS